VLEDRKLLSLVIAAATSTGKGLDEAISTITQLCNVLLNDINRGLPGRNQTEGVYQVPIVVDIPLYRRTGPRDFIVKVMNAVNSDGARKYHLDLQLQTLVTNIRFDATGARPKAVGVDYLSGKSLYHADPRTSDGAEGVKGSINASREVIIAAGAFNTPQILKLTGIGPKDELDKWKFPS
jgi:choline dehydrogenase